MMQHILQPKIKINVDMLFQNSMATILCVCVGGGLEEEVSEYPIFNRRDGVFSL